MRRLNVLLIEPYYGGSHQRWADEYQRASRHHVALLTLPAQAWKWRMQGGAVTLARMYHERGITPDVILASDMADLSTFRALTRHTTAHVPTALYFHENQLTYPQNQRQGHGWRYGFINYVSALAADAVYFNSPFHHDAFFAALPNMLKHFYDYNELDSIAALQAKASVLPLGLDLARLQPYSHDTQRAVPLILWNHRWEPDKNPALFLKALVRLAAEGVPFEVAIVGENVNHTASPFDRAPELLGERLIHFGYVDGFADYARLLWAADYVVSTAHQEFFGGAIAEAVACGCVPILPNRLNYPHLIPPAYHDALLYNGDTLAAKLRAHLNGTYTVDRDALQRHVIAFDWGTMAGRYDDVLAGLVIQHEH
jgi:glycosyltransferase involved in cell wall biosynthesis